MAEKFCLKWNDFQTNVSNTFRKLRKSDHFYDVTLVSDDQQQVSAHKVVLASSSEYFKNILTSNKHTHPMLCLNGVNAADLKNILDFLYNGEIQIYQDHLDQFLAIAQRFQLDGLLQGNEENPPSYGQLEDEEKGIYEYGNEDSGVAVKVLNEADDYLSPVKIQKIISVESSNFENIEELDQQINDMIENAGVGHKRRCYLVGRYREIILMQDSMLKPTSRD